MKTLLMILVAMLVSACSDNHPAPQTYVANAQPAAAPLVVQQSDSGMSSALLGGIAGYMLGSSSGSRQAAAPTQYVERHHFYRVEREPKAEPAKPSTAPLATPPAKDVRPMAPSYAATPSPKPTVSYSGTLASARTYSPPSYTSRPGAYSGRR